jgi:hypothetical protein
MKKNKPTQYFIVAFLMIIISGFFPAMSMAVVTEMSVLDTYTGTDADEINFKSGFKDNSGNIYFASDYVFPVQVHKYTGSTLDFVSSLTLNSGEEYPYAAAAHNGYGYVGLWDGLGRIVKIDLSNFTRVGVLDPEDGNAAYVGAAIDEENNFAYFTTNSSPAKIVKVDLSDFSVDSILTLNSGENSIWSTPIIDTANDVMYVGIYASPARIVKINLADFTRTSAVTLDTGENAAYGITYDPDGQFLFVGTLTIPGKIVKVNAATMQKVSTLEIDQNSIASNSLGYDTEFDKLYVLSGTSNPKFYMIDPSDMSIETSITLSTSNYIDATIYDIANKVVYFGSYGDPAAQIVKVQLYDEAADPAPAPEPEPTPPPTPPQFSSSARAQYVKSISSPTPAPVSPEVTQQAINNIITQNKSLFLEAISKGIVLPPYILNLLGVPADTPSIPSVRDLALNSVGDDVLLLQKLLNSQGFLISETGQGSVGNETKYFGTLTQQALIRYQNAKGISPASGYFGALTRNQMKTANLNGLWW